jgi:FMNH2-dependent dimethyl sulfone monooxygenase
MADEFVTVMKRLWTEDDNLTFTGQWYKTAGAFGASPYGLPVLVSAALHPPGWPMPPGIRTSSWRLHRADPQQACLLASTYWVHQRAARQQGREIKVLVNPHVICRPRASPCLAPAIVDERDEVALAHFFGNSPTAIKPHGGSIVRWTGP